MNSYNLYCTEEQTKKAHNLGAPLRKFTNSDSLTDPHWITCNFGEYYTPTAEQMLGWLEEQEDISEVDIFYDMGWTFNIWDFTLLLVHSDNVYYTRKEATLAAIDAALEYLTNQKTK